MAAAPANPPHGSPGHVHGDDGLEDDPGQLAAQFELVQREMQRVERRLGALEEAMAETQQAAAAVRHLAEAQGAQEILLPLGAGVHVAARIAAGAPILMPLGAGYFTEDTPAPVTAALEQRGQSIAQQFQAASQDAERLAQVAAAINDRLLQSQGS